MHRTACALTALLVATAAHAVQQRDLDGDGVADAVYDEATGLSWQADAGAMMGSWYHALEEAQRGGWFLPCVADMRTLLHDSLGLPAGGWYGEEPSPFRNLNGGFYWTADGFVDDSWYAWSGYTMATDQVVPLDIGDTALVWLAYSGDVAAVAPAPEPTTWALMAVGLAALLAVRARSQALPAAPR